MPDFIAEPAEEHDHDHDVVMHTTDALVKIEEATIVILGKVSEGETAGLIRPVQTSQGPEFMSIDDRVVKRQEMRLTRDGLLMSRWSTEDLWEGPLDTGLE